jgi:ribosomal protein L11 methyltransferase
VTVPALRLLFTDRTADDRDLATAALLDFDTAAIHELRDTEWLVFFRSSEDRDASIVTLQAYCEPAPVDVEADDWARRTQDSLRAIAVGDLIVAPPWDLPETTQGPAPHVIVIEPSMGFGTAHHATTRLCLRALQEIDLRGKRVLDIGTGSGVLAIAAVRLGAREVVAVDNDPDALAAARDNVARNGVAVDLRVADLQRDRFHSADVVLANLTGAMLACAAAELAALARGGTLIVSGLLQAEADAVCAALAPFSSEIRRDDEEGWASFACTIPGAVRA